MAREWEVSDEGGVLGLKTDWGEYCRCFMEKKEEGREEGQLRYGWDGSG